MRAYQRSERGVLRACDVGHRVVVRRRLESGPTGRPLQTDLLGELIALDERRIVVRSEDGQEHTIALVDVVAAKRVGPRPPRYSRMLALERIADRAWPAPVHERLGEWYLRAADGWTNRANSALPLGDAGMPADEAIEACRRWYAGHGLTPRITVPLPVRRDVADALAVRGWVAQPRVLVQTAVLAAMGPPFLQVELHAEPSEDFLALIAARKAGLPAASRAVLMGPPAVRFAEIRAGDGTLAATARGAVVEQWLHIGLVEVVPAARRRGLARAASTALAEWASRQGATSAILQVEEDNTAAVAVYRRLGFTTHHRYITFHT